MTKLSRQDLCQRLASVRLFSLDVDGVLTDGGLYYTEAGDAMRRYHVRDGMGIKMAQKAGLTFAIITMSSTPAIALRGAALGIEQTHMGIHDKVAKLAEICQQLGLRLDQVAHIGDDVNDLDLLRVVGLPLTVADAIDEAKELAAYVTSKPGGAGAVREICDAFLAGA